MKYFYASSSSFYCKFTTAWYEWRWMGAQLTLPRNQRQSEREGPAKSRIYPEGTIFKKDKNQ